MQVEWNVVATLVAPVVALFVGAALDRYLLKRPKVVSYLGHVSGITFNRGDSPITVNTHSVVIRNAGQSNAKFIRLGHRVLPDFQIYPDIDYQVKELPGGGKEIVIPQLAAQRQVMITYLYFPPLTWDQVNSYSESDDGPVKIVNVLPTVQLPRWIRMALWVLTAYGTLAVLYSLYALAVWLWR